jgi:hypothetical protein
MKFMKTDQNPPNVVNTTIYLYVRERTSLVEGTGQDRSATYRTGTYSPGPEHECQSDDGNNTEDPTHSKTAAMVIPSPPMK